MDDFLDVGGPLKALTSAAMAPLGMAYKLKLTTPPASSVAANTVFSAHVSVIVSVFRNTES